MSKIINFEGVPGVGKTTALNYVKSYCIEAGLSCVNINDLMYYKGDRVGKKIFDIMRYGQDAFMRLGYPYIEAFLSQAIRYNIVYETINEYKKYDIVFEDRGLDTYFSYMLARINREYKKSYDEIIDWLEKLNMYCPVEYACSVLLMDNLSECKKRYSNKNEKPFSDNDWQFLSDVKDAYVFLSKRYNRIRLFNVNDKDQVQVGQHIIQTILPILQTVGDHYGV
jgi:thymidylate kinase